MQRLRQIVLVLLCLISVSAFASSEPVDLLKNTSDNIVSSLAKLKKANKLNTRYISRLVNRDLVPLVDADRMAMAVVGRQYWNKATPAQQKAFIREFTKLIINTYAAAFASYNNDKVQVYPLRRAAGDFATVKTAIIRPNGSKISVNYDMTKTDNGWKVTDFSIENIGLVSNYRSQFKPVLRQSGLAGLLKRLQQKNRR